MEDLLKKNRKYLAVAISVLLLVVCYQLAFYRTIDALNINKALQSKNALASDLTGEPGALNRQLENLDKALSQYQSDSASLRANALTIISSVAKTNNARLEEVPVEDPMFHSPQFTIQRLAFSGDFNALVKTLYRLESTQKIGMIRSVSIRSSKNIETHPSQKNVMDLLTETTK